MDIVQNQVAHGNQPGPTSPIPTTSATVTRPAEVFTIAGVANSACVAQNSTLILEGQVLSAVGATAANVLDATDVFLEIISNKFASFVASGSTTLTSTATLTPGSPFRAEVTNSNTGRSVGGLANIASDGHRISTATACNTAGGSMAIMWYRMIGFYNQVVSNNALLKKLVVGAPL